MKWSHPYILGWLAILAWLLVWELYALIDRGLKDPMLTQVTVRFVPWWITMPFILWLFIHFAVRYSNPSYIQNLRSAIQ